MFAKDNHKNYALKITFNVLHDTDFTGYIDHVIKKSYDFNVSLFQYGYEFQIHLKKVFVEDMTYRRYDVCIW